MTETHDPELKLRDAIREYVRDWGDGGLVGDWILVAHFIPADGRGDSYITTGRDGLPEHSARGLLDYAQDQLPETYGQVDDYDLDYECDCGDYHGDVDI